MHYPSLALAALAATFGVACGPQPDDATGGTLACGIAPLVFDARGDVVQGETSEACARVERRGIPVDGVDYKAFPYAPVRLVVRAPGVGLDVSGGGGLVYGASHHNWEDTIEA